MDTIKTIVFARSLSNIIFKLWMMRGETGYPIDFGLRGQRSRSVLALFVEDLVGTIQTTVFVQTLSNFTCRLWMMRGGTLLIFGHGGLRSRSTLALCV